MDFKKFDSEKNRLELIEPKFIQGVGQILTIGAKKYAPGNWQKVDDINRYKGALLRHIYAYLEGEKQDPETGLSHLYHAGCNLMFLDYFDRKEPKDKTMKVNYKVVADGLIQSVNSSQLLAIKTAKRLAKTHHLVTVETVRNEVIAIFKGKEEIKEAS